MKDKKANENPKPEILPEPQKTVIIVPKETRLLVTLPNKDGQKNMLIGDYQFPFASVLEIFGPIQARQVPYNTKLSVNEAGGISFESEVTVIVRNDG